MVLSGQIEEVSRYCESDVVNPYRVWLQPRPSNYNGVRSNSEISSRPAGQ